MSKKKNPKVGAPKKSTPSKSKRLFPAFIYNKAMICGLIMVVSFVLYGKTLNYGYTQDDAIVITDNMYTKDGVAGIPGILGNDTFYGFFKKEGKQFLVEGGRYRPLTLVFFAMGWSVFGEEEGVPLDGDPASAKIFHFFTVLFYGLTGIVLYLLFIKMLRPSKGDNFAFFVSFVAAILFITHPIHTEVVANIKGQDEIVALLGSLTAMYFSLKGYYEKNITFTILAGVAFFLALLAKENPITFLAVLPLTYFIFTKADAKEIAMQTVPFLIAGVVFLIIRQSVLGGGFGSENMELMNNPFIKIENGKYIAYSGGEKIATIFYTLGQYVKLLLFPHPLTHDYYPYHIGTMNFGDWRVILSLLMYVGLGIYALMGILKKDIVAFGIAFYIITLSIVSNIVFPVGTNMAERFMFMPSVGFCLVIGVLVYRFAKYISGKKKLDTSSFLMPLAFVGVAVLLFSYKTNDRNSAWESNYTLFSTDVEVSKNSAKLRNSMGGSTIEAATKLPETNPERNILLNEAIAHLQEAIRIHPNYKNAYLLLGNAHQYLKKFDEAIQFYNQALQLDSEYSDAENNLTLAYRNGGKHHGEVTRNIQKSIQYLEIAHQRDSNDIETLRLMGIAYGMSGNGGKAVEYLEKALKLQPNNPSIMFNLGIALNQFGDAARGAQLMQKAKEIDPTMGQ
jgi:tetratricopeptide (TPR) repeat protein